MRPAGPEQIFRFFFRAEGRIGRTEYALGLGFIYALNFAIVAYIFVHGESAPDVVLLLLVPAVSLAVGLAVIIAKRCHDIGLPGSFFLLCLVPVAGVVWLLALALVPGNPGQNAYGPPPAFVPKPAPGD